MGDTFYAECEPNEVVVMNKADFGRMHHGKCVDAEAGKIFKME